MTISTHLSNSLREKIIENVTSGAYADKYAVLEAERVELTKRYYRLIVPENVEAQMKRLPAGSFTNVSGRCKRHIGDGDDTRRYNMIDMNFGPDGVLMPACSMSGYTAVSDTKLAKEFRSLDEKVAEIDNMVGELKLNAKAIVYSVKTVKKLLEIWPEAKQFIPQGNKPEELKTFLPAVVTDKLNKLLAAAKPNHTEAVAA